MYKHKHKLASIKYSNQGFAHIELFSLALIVILICSAGWVVWQHSYKISNTRAEQTESSNNTKLVLAQSPPTEYGFTVPNFYPSGEPFTVSPGRDGAAKRGKAYTIGSGFGKFSGGFVTKDWVPNDTDKTTKNYGFVAYTNCAPYVDNATRNQATVTILEEDGLCVKVTGSETYDISSNSDQKVMGAQLTIEKRFDHNSLTAGVRFRSHSAYVKDFSDLTLRNAFGIEYVNFAKGIKELDRP